MTLAAVPASAAQAAQEEAAASCYSRFTNEWFCLDYVSDRRGQIFDATLEHLAITISAVLLGLALATALALLARRGPRLESVIIGFSTGLYTVPSLALLPLLVPFTGLSATTVVIGLGLYCLTILVRALLDGLRSVPEEVKESAIGLGYSTRKLLWRVELPLAVPVIIAGLRVATVSTVALTTIGTLVAYGGLGDLINHGRQYDFRAELLTASVLCVLLAVVLDVVLVLTQRALTPWARGVRA